MCVRGIPRLKPRVINIRCRSLVISPEGNSPEDFIAPDFSLGSYVLSWDP